MHRRRANILHFEEKALIDLAETREKEKERSKYSIKEKKERKVNGVAGEEIWQYQHPETIDFDVARLIVFVNVKERRFERCGKVE